MTEGPTLDGRSEEELLEDLRRRGGNYTREWDPYSEDPGTTLLMLFARYGSDVLKRLNGVPHKHRVEFLNALDFDRRPPQSARVPLTFTTAADLAENVVVPGGTQVLAETVDGDNVTFEIPGDEGFEATPAALESVFSVDPDRNSIFEHRGLLAGQSSTRLFTGQNLQNHELYLGHEDLLNLEAGSSLTIPMQTPSGEILEERVRWEYYGEDDEGTLGWHPLPFDTEDAIEDPFGDEVGLEEKMRRVSDQIQRFGETEDGDEDVYEPSFRFPGPTVELPVDGIQSRWIRALIPGEESRDFEVDLESVRLDVEAGGDEMEMLRPDMVYTNDVPVSLEDEDDFYPFGRMPQPPATLYLSSEEAFTKKNGAIDLEFVAPEGADEDEEDEEESADDENDEETETITVGRGGPLSGPPELSWEYWNGNGWTQLTLEAEETAAFTQGGTVSFTVPEDLEATSVSGHRDYWIRARLVSGNYGQPQYEMTPDGSRGELIQQTDPPIFEDIALKYGQRNASFQHVISHNNVAFHTALTPEADSIRPDGDEPMSPFESLADDQQTLYLGFDAPLIEGPINLYIPMEDKAYPRGFEPGIRWEYCADPESWTWKKLNVYDGTEGLTEPGIVSINFPEETLAFELFGEPRHWIRARVTRDAFRSGGGHARDEADRSPDTQIAAVDDDTQGSKTPPTLEGVFPNTQWAYNERTIEETLGSSDGSPDQTFECANVPITEAEIWIDESSNLSAAEERTLELEQPEHVRRSDPGGNGSDRFWIRWHEVSDFLDSDASSRHYRLDRTNGTVTFGNGQYGAIPPNGENNIFIDYKTGGGSDGNVDANAVTDLRSSISLIDSVTNLRQSDGGTDTESLDQTIERAPKQIKNRGRAVSAEDFEEIAKASSRQLSRVRCEPEMDEDGNRSPGWVTLLVIPRERRDRPTPSLELRQRVKEAVSEQAPATLVDHDDQRIVVRGPDYAEVSVDTTVETKGVESITNLKNTIERTLSDYFHPLTGKRDGSGWEFGRAPRLSQLSTLIEGTDGVDRVTDITMTIETAQEEKIIRDPSKTPLLSRDEMISSGTHDVNVIMQGQR